MFASKISAIRLDQKTGTGCLLRKKYIYVMFMVCILSFFLFLIEYFLAFVLASRKCRCQYRVNILMEKKTRVCFVVRFA